MYSSQTSVASSRKVKTPRRPQTQIGMPTYQTRTFPTPFDDQVKRPSSIIDRIENKRKIAETEPLHNRTPEGQKKLSRELDEILQNSSRLEENYRNQPKTKPKPTIFHEKRIYHDFCEEFKEEAPKKQEVTIKVEKTTIDIINTLREEQEKLDSMQREIYRIEMGLDDPPEVNPSNIEYLQQPNWKIYYPTVDRRRRR